MMLVVQKGKCLLPTNTIFNKSRVYGVYYKGQEVYHLTRAGISVGKYTPAYIVSKDGNFYQFGEIKFTVGTIIDGHFACNYVLCEY